MLRNTLFLAICWLVLTLHGAVAASPSTPLILISIDGFRADYLNRGLSPNLARLAREGVHASAMRPAFPSVTFPNHFTIVTGLYPDHHGIINNTFEDPGLQGKFRMSTIDSKWWGDADPIWVTAEQHGIHTATEFWPGSEVAFHGVRPEHYEKFDHDKSGDARVDSLLAWFDLPAPERPTFLTLYFDIVDGAGHLGGPDSELVNTAIGQTDASIGRLLAGLKARGIDANLIILADHGMIGTAPERTIFLDDLVDLNAAKPVFTEAVAGLNISADAKGATARSMLLKPQPHMTCSNKADLPARLHYGTNPRIPDVICIAEPGYLIETREEFSRRKRPLLGEHGYDPDTAEMAALFIAHGPAFVSGLEIGAFDNVDVYPLMARILEIPPAKNDGNSNSLRQILKSPVR
jgi:predicted AlkP superfamily pyrophosphatase or phosphodiesterase